MSEAILLRHKDNSNVSGTGVVADIYEAPDGAVAIRWRGDHPAWGIWPDIRDLEAIHGHQGDSVVQYLDKDRLLRAYQLVMPYLLTSQEHMRPLMVSPHPDHPDRLRVIFLSERAWKWWVALFDGSSDTATHVEVNGEIAHTWFDPAGDIWLQYFTPAASPESHDDPEVER